MEGMSREKITRKPSLVNSQPITSSDSFIVTDCVPITLGTVLRWVYSDTPFLQLRVPRLSRLRTKMSRLNCFLIDLAAGKLNCTVHRRQPAPLLLEMPLCIRKPGTTLLRPRTLIPRSVLVSYKAKRKNIHQFCIKTWCRKSGA